MNFKLSESEKLLLDHYLPNTFFAFIEGFVNKINNYLIEEFENPLFQEAYLKELQGLKKKVLQYVYESDLAYSWINLENYIYQDPAVPPEEAFIKMGYFTADFQHSVQKLLEAHFPQANSDNLSSPQKALEGSFSKAQQKEAPRVQENPKTQTSSLEKAKNVPDMKKPLKLENDSNRPPLSPANMASRDHHSQESLNKLTEKKIEAVTPIKKNHPNPKPKTALEKAASRYKHEYNRYKSIFVSHPQFMQFLNKRKAAILAVIENSPIDHELIQFIQRDISLQPLPDMAEKEYGTAEDYDKASHSVFQYTSYYAKLAARLVSNVVRQQERELPPNIKKYFTEVIQLIHDHLSRFSFYLIPSKKHKDEDYIKSKGKESKNFRYIFGVLLQEELEEQQIKKVILQGTIEYY